MFNDKNINAFDFEIIEREVVIRETLVRDKK